jgi:hypothetical protein
MPRMPLAALAASVFALAVAGLALAHGGGHGDEQGSGDGQKHQKHTKHGKHERNGKR